LRLDDFQPVKLAFEDVAVPALIAAVDKKQEPEPEPVLAEALDGLVVAAAGKNVVFVVAAAVA
jgi:hypothetical protein